MADREYRLHYPNRGVQINWQHPLSRGLIYYMLGGYEYVGRKWIEPFGTTKGTFGTPTALGTGYTNPNDSGSGAKSTPDGRFYEFGTSIGATFMVWVNLSALNDYSTIFDIPYRNDPSWSDPYGAFHFGRWSNETKTFFAYCDSGATVSRYVSDAGIISNSDYGITTNFGVIRDHQNCLFIKNGGAYSKNAVTTGVGNTVPFFSNKQPAIIGNRSDSAPGEQTAGNFALVAIWNRSLSFNYSTEIFSREDELNQFYHDPFCIFKPPSPARIWYVSAVIAGTTCWGHSTGVTEVNTRTFATNWTGNGRVVGSGDSEKILLSTGQYMESEVVQIGGTIIYTKDKYQSGYGSITMKYRTGATQVACEAASYSTYTVPVASDGYFQVRLEA